MMNIDISTAPFALDDGRYTQILVDGDAHWFDGKNNRLYRYVICMPMTRWLLPYQERLFIWPGFLSALSREVNERTFHFRFYGSKAAYQLFCREIALQMEQLDRQQLQAQFSYGGGPDANQLVLHMQKIMVTLQDELFFSREENRRVNQLRKQLNLNEIHLEQTEGGAGYSVWRIAPEEALADCAAMGLVCDLRSMKDAQIEGEYLRLLQEKGMNHGHMLRCYLLHDESQIAEQAQIRLQSALRKKGKCTWQVCCCASQEMALADMQAYLRDEYWETAYLPATLEACLQLVQRYIGQANKYEAIMDHWRAFCSMMLPQQL